MADKADSNPENQIKAENGCSEHCDGHHHSEDSAKLKDKKKKGKNAKGGSQQEDAGALLPAASLQDLKKAMEMLSLTHPQGAVKTTEDAMAKQYEFWSTQPVPKINEEITVNEPIEKDKHISEIRAEPYTLPPGFIWDTLALDDPMILQELYQLLNENYVEDDDNMFRFDYSADFLLWALKPPGWHKEWHCGVLQRSLANCWVSFLPYLPTYAYMTIHKKWSKSTFCVFTKSCVLNE